MGAAHHFVTVWRLRGTLEMDRRRAPDEKSRQAVPATPPPTFRWLLRERTGAGGR